MESRTTQTHESVSTARARVASPLKVLPLGCARGPPPKASFVGSSFRPSKFPECLLVPATWAWASFPRCNYLCFLLALRRPSVVSLTGRHKKYQTESYSGGTTIVRREHYDGISSARRGNCNPHSVVVGLVPTLEFRVVRNEHRGVRAFA